MAELKTRKTEASVESFLNGVADPDQRADAFRILEIMKEVTGLEPRMWGASMVGFGDHHYKYESGCEGDCFQTGFAPRKGQLSLYIMPGVGRFQALLKKLGKHKTGKSCLYIKRLDDVDMDVLRELIEVAFAEISAPAKTPKRTPAKKRAKA